MSELTPFRRWEHEHTFGQEVVRPGERRTLVVITITAAMMVIEIAAGVVYGSMALLADGLHMASHTAALGISYFAYRYARKYAGDPRFSFGTGKVNALAGFAGAILLAVFALMMIWHSVERFINPVQIAYAKAITVAIVGLVVNGASALILGQHSHEHDHHHGHDHHHHHHDHHHAHEDHNLRSAYLHVLADALTSVTAIAALLCAKWAGWIWMDPLMGVVGATLVSCWSYGLLRDTSKVLLDSAGPERVHEAIRKTVEDGDGTQIVDLHVWQIGPGIYSAIIAVLSADPKQPEYYKRLLPEDVGLAHVTIEVNVQAADTAATASAQSSVTST
jgi:cation diffusion facilitator family transporter